ncbi:MAG: hypothetical protein ABFD82_19445 [Syntrophaceae bacterium]
MVGIVVGVIGLIVLAIIVLQWWLNWRRRTVIEAGAKFGLRPLGHGESLPLVPVPLFDRPKCKYLVILHGHIKGYECAFFDLYTTFGAEWDFQSAVMLQNPNVIMPKFQLQTLQWTQPRKQTCGDAIDVPGRESVMASLRLSAEDPEWARRIFSQAAPEFFQNIRSGKWTIEGFQNTLIIYRWGKRIPARKLRDYVNEASELAIYIFSLI